MLLQASSKGSIVQGLDQASHSDSTSVNCPAGYSKVTASSCEDVPKQWHQRWWRTWRARLKRSSWDPWFVQPEQRRLRGGLVAACSFLTRWSRGGDGTGLCSLVTSDRTKGNGMELQQGKFILDISKRFFTQRVVGHWNRFSREVVTEQTILI